MSQLSDIVIYTPGIYNNIMEVLVTTMLEIVQKVGTLLKFVFQLDIPSKFRHLAGQRREGEKKKDEFQRKLFECPGCLDIPLPPIFTCSSGHIVCRNCKEELTSCPQCQGNYDGQARNFVVETIITTRSFHCRFSPDGCTRIVKGVDLLQHEKKCPSRHIPCTIDSTNGLCDGSWRGSVSAYYSHLVLVHDINLVFRHKNVTFKGQIDPSTKEFLGFLQPTAALKVIEGKNFVIQSLYDDRSKNVFISTTGIYKDETCDYQDSLLPPQTNPAQTTIRLVNPLESQGQVGCVWTGPVNNVHDTLEEILKKGNGLVIPYETLIRTANISNATATWNFQINFIPPVSKMSHRSSGVSFLFTMKENLPKYLRPLFSSGWSFIAPAFTILFILFFVIFV